ncbi:UbiH/UbiF/VisC/COQ6 family ubiquinone biosynthesis hydroxylase [Larsenimonas suaedae]|uniref:UbiH/UbiF/VisC/COQ6 family ubiquinone biosynthesis hydroxylase n=1 Tax=Larsenimonas suaedae TaxID=1851019 RepID=A0ABU1GR95_9GAMM|nr:UbiH/UbiF/VisC/COQ6 family ubiquinone biosynthesis hydroxylase [Larsenimonas suaedae]MCM2972658.1 UbiH/UbiF/VisC/COQ6 family ubiquinone biosynthesis hydroxylase [Larsenimonas suaedae]MDR5894545.1 UbiH/UbiF/VisC/COQ6 family ubiquinone biosynthesis hydroxylase [Larsenimonas suaedae]
MQDVIVVGAGMVGSALALSLAKGGLTVCLVDASAGTPCWQTSMIDQRVSAITQASRYFLEHLGVWPSICTRRVSAYKAMTVWDGEGSGEVTFDAEDAASESLGHIVENSAITDALHEALDAHPGVTCDWQFSASGYSLTGEGVRLYCDDGRTHEARLLVGADGARSNIRHFAGIRTRDRDTGQRGVVTTVTHALPHQRTARQIFLPGGPLAFLPLMPDERELTSSIVWSSEAPLAESRMALSDEAFKAELADAFEYRLGSITSVAPRVAFPLIQRHAERYTSERVALVGDAAHSIHPLAGQGVNLGFLDAATLSEEVLTSVRRGIAVGNAQALSRYSRRRRGDNAQMLMLMDAFRLGFKSQWAPLQLARNLGLNGVEHATPLKRFFIRQAFGQRGSVPASMTGSV